MNLKFWKRDKEQHRDETPSSSGAMGGGFGAATGRSGSIGNMGGGGADVPQDRGTETKSSTGSIGDSNSGRH